MSHGTFRNKISAMMKRGEVQVVSYSPQGFYTLKGTIFAAYHTGVAAQSPFSSPSLSLRYLKKHPLYRLIQNIPFEKSALHDIRLRFTAPGIWAVLSNSNNPTIDPVSKDIRLISQEINDLDIKVTIHHTDTVSVVIGCSCAPVAVDTVGVNRLSSSLMLIQKRLSTEIRDTAAVAKIPHHMDWIVTMWHFGTDASVEYKGDMFHASWKVGEKAVIALYSKEWKDGKCRIRKERQEYPNGPLIQALEEKLHENPSSS